MASPEKNRLNVRVLIVTGSYPPAKCGVGDYTYHLAQALSRNSSVEVGILTGKGASDPSDNSAIRIFRSLPGWRLENALQLRRLIAEFHPDLLHIQYPTQGYVGRLPKYIPFLARSLGLPVVQTWHEYFVSSGAGWPNFLACNALIYARPDFLQKIPSWVKLALSKIPTVYVPNASTIPVTLLSTAQATEIKQKLSGGKPIVCFFGFAHINKGLERLFEIADPAKHHLVLICDLKATDPYQASILRIISGEPWINKVTVTGFLSSLRVAEILSVSDAVVFPFPGGAGEWNTSLKAAQASGTFSLATTQNASVLGYHEKENTYFAGCDQMSVMRTALEKHLGKRNPVSTDDEWKRIASMHWEIYKSVVRE